MRRVLVMKEEFLEGQRKIYILLHFDKEWHFPDEELVTKSGIVFKNTDISRLDFVLAIYEQGEASAELKWVPYQIVFDLELRKQCCPEGVVDYECLDIGRELIDEYFRNKYLSSTRSLTLADGSKETDYLRLRKAECLKLRRVKPEEMSDVFKARKAVFVKLGGRLYKGHVVQKRDGLVFSGIDYQTKTERIKTIAGRIKENDLFVEDS